MFRFSIGGFEATVFALQNTTGNLRLATVAAATAAGEVLIAAVRTNASLTDHSLKDLARLDHPYARRHGSIQIHKGSSSTLLDTRSSVHMRTGRFVRSIRGYVAKTSKGSSIRYNVIADRRVAKHAGYVIQGTRVMLPRDIIWETAEAPGTRKAMMGAVVRVLGEELRTKVGVRFGSAPMPLPGGGS
jgi:hypothetical protein